MDNKISLIKIYIVSWPLRSLTNTVYYFASVRMKTTAKQTTTDFPTDITEYAAVDPAANMFYKESLIGCFTHWLTVNYLLINFCFF